MKSILIIDTPKNCLDCQLMVDGWCYAVKADRTQEVISAKDRTCWCPLRPLPPKLDANDWHRMFSGLFSEREAKGYGWNACIDEITGEKE